jgi:hypothetical protein
LVSVTLFPNFLKATDTITAAQPLRSGETIISAGEEFELGFFSSGRSNLYVGIWYKKVPSRTIVWVANRDNPVINSLGQLQISENGNLGLVDNSSNTIWATNHSMPSNTVAQLLDSGNFVLRQVTDQDPQNYLWQSFDYPTDTLLPGMKLGWDRKTGLHRVLRSWRNENDPSSGEFSFNLDISGFPEIFLRKNQETEYRSGPWNGIRFSGVPEMKPLTVLSFKFMMNPDEVYYSFELKNTSLYSRLFVNHSGELQRFTWIDTSQIWNKFWYAPKDQCDSYKECGDYGICDTNSSPVCKCLNGFEPRNPDAWQLRDGSGGCLRKNVLNCINDGFLPLKNMKLPESSSSFVDEKINLRECEKMCLRNCSCRGYSSVNISNGGSGCAIWISDLVDMRQYAVAEGGQDFYIRMSASDLGSVGSPTKHRKVIMAISITAAIAVLLSVFALYFVYQRRKLQAMQSENIEHKGSHERSHDFLLTENVIPRKHEYSGETTTEDLDLPLYDFNTIAMSTNSFSDNNKLGEGGFGIVYKGVLVEGQAIAVKRLSKNSGQGVEEFKNECRLIAKLQHRNLVRLLGCCVEIEEKMLIYEYMENRSLDSILFHKEKSALLDWKTRFNIICGIARGLLYLHQDSRFRIIHRDLKASNILLDKEMTPKISDFGMARIFGGDQTEANTMRVVGTYGYMAPEYAMDGLFSAKSDVFSFGVLVLEIVSGKKNRGFYYMNNQENLLGYAWKLWREEKGIEMIDSATSNSYSSDELLRCVQVGLLCVQEHAEDRPTMATVVLMLNSESTTLPQPKNPGFCLGRRAETDSSSSKQDESFTLNQISVTMLDGR